jgi:hypothetical protein
MLQATRARQEAHSRSTHGRQSESFETGICICLLLHHSQPYECKFPNCTSTFTRGDNLKGHYISKPGHRRSRPELTPCACRGSQNNDPKGLQPSWTFVGRIRTQGNRLTNERDHHQDDLMNDHDDTIFWQYHCRISARLQLRQMKSARKRRLVNAIVAYLTKLRMYLHHPFSMYQA